MMKRIHPDFDTRYLALHRDQTVDGVWDRAHNYYGYGLEEATRDGMTEYADYLSSMEAETTEPIPTPAKDRKELARVAFMRSDRSQDHSTGRRQKSSLPKADIFESHIDAYKARNDGSVGGNVYITDTSDAESIILNESDSATNMSEYQSWIEETGQIDTTSNRNLFFMDKTSSESDEEEKETFIPSAGPTDKINIKVMTRNGSKIIEVQRDELNAANNDSDFDERFLYGENELFAKLEGMKSSAARRATTEHTYQGYDGDNETIDWLDGYTLVR